MSNRFVRCLVCAVGLLLALPQLAAAGYWQVKDTFTGQVVYPTGTVSDLGDVVSPGFVQRVYEIRNVDTSFDLELGPCSVLGDPSFVIATFPYPAGQTSTKVPHGLAVTMTVRHFGNVPGTQTATVRCDGSLEQISIQVRGRVLDPNPFVVLDTAKGKNIPNNGTFDFGSTPANLAADRDFVITNLGNQPLTLGISVTGSGYSVVPPLPPASLNPGATAALRLRLLSASTGTFAGQLRIGNNDPNDNPYLVNLTGSVTPVSAPQIRVTDNGNNNAVVVKGSTINLGSALPNTDLDRTFTITNLGTAQLSITNATSFLSGAGYTIYTSAPNVLSASSSGSFTVRFKAAAVATYPGSVSLANNDSANNPFAFNLLASVVATAPRIRIDDQTIGQTIEPGSTISFGTTAPNAVVTHAFRIYNLGNAPLTLGNPLSFVTGSGFTLSNPPSSPIPPAPGNAVFFVNFQASATGSYSGSARLLHNDSTKPSPFTFGLQANVQPTPSTVTLSATDSEASETAPNGGQLTLTRTGSNTMPLTVSLSRAGTAIDGTDYGSIATTQTFAAGQSTLILPVTPIDDSAIEDVETVTLSLASGTGYTAGSPATGTVSITNDDYTACTPSANRLCLQGGRFEATLTATANGASYTGQTLPLGDSSGGFWLFSPANIEVAVKVLDGSPVNGKIWTYHGAATDVAYTLTVLDRANASQVRTFSKPAGTFCGGGDTSSFTKSAPLRPSAVLAFDAVPATAWSKALSCVANTTTACLLGSRFQVRVQRGGVYQQVVPVTSQTAFFWFFAPDNTEIFVKMLDGTLLNNRFWLYFGSMTDQSYTIEVTDTSNGLVKSYASAAGFCGGADVNAF